MKQWSSPQFASSAVAQQATSNLSSATQTNVGVVRLATPLETEARTITDAVVTPADLANFMLKTENALPAPTANTIPKADGTKFNSYKFLGASNLKFVSSASGDDTIGDGSLWNAYLTITNALNLANPGDTIVVLPGVYAERIQLKDQVNLHFELGATLSYTAQNIGDILIYDNGIPVSVKITGHGIFQSLDAPVSNRSCFGIGQSAAASTLYIECLDVSVLGTQGNADAFGIGGASNLTVKCRSITALNYGVATDPAFTGSVTITADKISAATALYVQNGSVKSKGCLESIGAPAITVLGNGVVTHSGSINSLTSGTESINVSGSSTASVSGQITSVGPASIVQSGSLLIKDCQVSTVGYSPFIHSGGSLTLRNVDTVTSGSTDIPVVVESDSAILLYIVNSTLRVSGSPEASVVSGDAAPHNVKILQSASNAILTGTNITNLIATPNNVVDTGV